jgi:hypothetical protein
MAHSRLNSNFHVGSHPRHRLLDVHEGKLTASQAYANSGKETSIMEKLSYSRPTMKVHGSVEKLTQVFGGAAQDFINGTPVSGPGVGGSVSLKCDLTKFPVTCVGVPTP